MAGTQVSKVGDWIEVRPIEQIMATLDDNGALEALPFMPEMVQYAGRRFQVAKSAHKTCDPTGSSDLRRMHDAVHLEARCDGRAHDGCEARCQLFWKKAWLKPVEGPGACEGAPPAAASADLARLAAATRWTTESGEVRYRCQATEIVAATEVLPLSNLRQYFEDVASRNVGLGAFVRETAVTYAKLTAREALKFFRLESLLPSRRAAAEMKTAGPAAKAAPKLDLQPGELVRIRSFGEILATLDKNSKNRGLSLEREMLRHCGQTGRVLARVGKIIEEKSGKMIKLTSDCIMLEGLVCHGLDNRLRAFCPRGPYFYWREAWLRRIPGAEHGDVK